ncbi:MAG TPA: serine hydrolase domain-containing protein [Chthonomonadaceae bacterium]|nr:serine hydrolase domain-containing protein [Chthonomonadaceae bacterium]
MKRAEWTVLLLLMMFGGFLSARADKIEAQIDAYVNAQRQQRHIPGVSVAVVREGKVVFAKGYGLANVELEVPATRDTVYELLSVSKQFTAAAVLMLVEAGKVSLDAKVADYLPDIPDAWSAVTVRHLLTHTSGIMDYTDAPSFFENARQDATPEELLKPVKARPLQFAPGTRWRYSNSNYYLLGLIIEKVSGMKFADFLEERIFRPLGMTSTRMNDMTDIIPNRASGYHWLAENADKLPAVVTGYHGKKNVLQNAIYISPTRKWAAGAILSNVVDLARWDAALTSDRLLKPGTLQQMWAPARLNSGEEVNYGFGNELSHIRGHRMAGHQGGGMAFNTTLLHDLDDKLTVIVLCNQTTAPSQPMALHIASLYVPALSFAQDKPIEDKEPQVSARLKQILLDAQQGKADATLFAPEVQQLTQFIRRAGQEMLGKLGALQSFVLLERRDEGNRRLYRYRAVFGTTPIQWTFMLNPEGKVFSIEPTQE